MAYCKNCGNRLGDNMRFCTNCGTPLDGEAPVQKPAQPAVTPAKKGTGLIVLLIAAILALLAVAAVLVIRLLPARQEAPVQEVQNPEVTVAEEPEAVQWEFEENSGTLRIYGQGEMEDYDPNTQSAPWIIYKGAIRSVVVEEGVTKVGDYAFEGLSALSNVILPKTLEWIGSKGFANCTGLYSVYIPAGVNQMGDGAFRGCDNLVEFQVDPANAVYTTIGGALLTGDQAVFIQLPAAAKYMNYAIPETVRKIEDGAFYNCRNIQSVVIPGGVSEIGELTFSGCTSMKEITLPMNVRTIRPTAFTEKVYAADGTFTVSCVALKKIIYDGLEDWFFSMDIGWDNDNLYNATLHFVDPWDMPDSVVTYFETHILNR